MKMPLTPAPEPQNTQVHAREDAYQLQSPNPGCKRRPDQRAMARPGWEGPRWRHAPHEARTGGVGDTLAFYK